MSGRRFLVRELINQRLELEGGALTGLVAWLSHAPMPPPWPWLNHSQTLQLDLSEKRGKVTSNNPLFLNFQVRNINE